MSKAKEYYNKICYESNLWDEKNSKKLASKTLEDVKEQAEKKQEIMRLKGKGLYKVIELENLLTELEKLKL